MHDACFVAKIPAAYLLLGETVMWSHVVRHCYGFPLKFFLNDNDNIKIAQIVTIIMVKNVNYYIGD